MKKYIEPQGIRELGVRIGEMPTGKFNSITDVKGVKVGHCTLDQDDNIKTGVTVIMPNENIFNKKLIAGSFILNGAGELSGITQIKEWGILETPIALTNTMSVGHVGQGISKWMSKKFNKIWDQRYVIIPVVGECDDSFLNDSINFHIDEKHVLEAIKDCKSGEFPQGSVGGGTGMVCCDLKGGIGSSSRIVSMEGIDYTVGVLVMSNFGYMKDMKIDGYPVGQILEPLQGEYLKRVDNYGSIIVVVATDIPCTVNQINRLCKRAALGIGRVGTIAAHGSGEIVVGFSTGNVLKHDNKKPHSKLNVIMEDHMNGAYRAVIEATEEAILNSLSYSNTMKGLDNHEVPGIDRYELKNIIEKFTNLKEKLKAKY